MNRTRDSFFQPAATFDFDAFLKRAEELVNAGADLLDVGGVKAGPGDEVSESEELDRVVAAPEMSVGALKAALAAKGGGR